MDFIKPFLFLSKAIVPLIIFYIVGFGLLQKRPVLEDFLDGAKEGMKTVSGVMPTLIGLMTAVGVLRASGFLDFLAGLLAKPAGWIHLPPSIVDIFKTSGPDSLEGIIGSILMSSTETVFYCLSVYFGAVRITKTRYALSGALTATAAGIIASIIIGTAMAG